MTVEEVSGDRRTRLGGLDVAASVLVAFNFAVAQPILDLTGRFPQFFLARRSPRIDLYVLAFGLAVAVPVMVAGLVWIAGVLHRRLGTVLHVLVVGSLTASLAMQLLERFPGLRGAAAPILAAAAVAAGTALIVLYYRSRGVRSFVRIAAVSALLLPVLFLFSSSASTLVLRQSAVISGSALIRNPVPVVVLLLDELPVASLMNGDRGIDAEMFPGFARLASSSTWFRNATAVHDFTEIAVPAVLTGRYGDKRKLAISSNYPDNLFTLLGGAYDVRASEAFTQLCPLSICTTSTEAPPGFWRRWRAMASDLGIVYEHVVAPPSLEADLPPIDQTWTGFADAPKAPGADAVEHRSTPGLAEDPLGDLGRFVESIEPSQGPALWMAHVEVPHAPWRYLPSGKTYVQRSPIPGRTGQVWGDDEWLVSQAFQRHLLQVAAVDRQVGALIDRLERAGIYDRALVVVTADHGVAFRPGYDYRVIGEETVGGIAAVPFFVKLPGQTRAAIDDRPVQSFDVVPTIADVLDVEGMYPTDGASVFDPGPSRAAREVRSMRGFAIAIGSGGDEKYGVLRQKLDLFGSSGGVERLYRLTPGDHGDLLGSAVSAGGPAASGTASIDGLGSYERFDPSADVIRSLVSGTLRGVAWTPRIVAIAVNGRVVAVTRTFVKGGEVRFYGMVPPESFRRGVNRVGIFLVEDSDGGTVLRSIRLAV